MTTNPEQPVLDKIAALVDWHMEEGKRRGDGPDDESEDDYWSLPSLAGPPTDPLDYRRPREPYPGPIRPPTGPWWRCDDLANLTVSITRTAHIDWRATRWKVRVEERLVVDCLIERDGGIPGPVDFELDESAPPWGRTVKWMAVRSETKPEAGDWRLWERAALVPVGSSSSV